MPSPLLQLAWEPCLLDAVRNRDTEAFLKREAGSAPGWTRYFWTRPWFAKAMIRLGFDNGLLVHLDFDLAILVGLVVSQENSCRYCYAVARAMLRMLGQNEAQMQALEQRLSRTDLDPRTTAAIRFARVTNRANPIDGGAERAALQRAGFSTEEIRELAYVVASMGLLNRVSTFAALPPQLWERVPDRWPVMLLRPLITWLLKRLRKQGKPDPAAPPTAPLGTALIRAYQGTPIARVLAESISDLWTSDLLSQRIKILMFATIAQGIDCAVCRDEAATLAAQQGIDAVTLGRIVAHLDDPGLDDRNRAQLMFARESLWYEPQMIQRHAQALLAQVGVPVFVETLAVVTLANVITRLTAVIADPQ